MNTKTINCYALPGIPIENNSLMYVANIVMAELDTDLTQMRIKTRKREIVAKRQTMMYLLKMSGFGASEIGRYLLFNHATILYSVHRVENDMITDKKLRAFIGRMRNEYHYHKVVKNE